MAKYIGKTKSAGARKSKIIKKTGWNETEYRRELNNFRKRVKNYEQASGEKGLNTSKLFYEKIKGGKENARTIKQINATPTTSQNFKVNENLRQKYFENYKAGFRGGLFNSNEFKKTGYYKELKALFDNKTLSYKDTKRKADLVIKSMNEDRKLRRKLYEKRHGASPTGSKQYIKYEAESIEQYEEENEQ